MEWWDRQERKMKRWGRFWWRGIDGFRLGLWSFEAGVNGMLTSIFILIGIRRKMIMVLFIAWGFQC